MTNVTLFSQILQIIPRDAYHTAVQKFQTDKHSKGINSWTHLVAMLFCHFAKAHSVRDISNGIRSIAGNANHLGIQKIIPSRSSISYINEHRNWHMFRELYFLMKDQIQKEGQFLQRKKFKEINRKIYMLDSSIISVCIKVFPWATYGQQKGAIKLHTMLDYDGCLPSYVFMTAASQADVRHTRYMTLPPHSVVVMDRGYQSFTQFHEWTKQDIFFVTRLKDKINYIGVEELALPDNTAGAILRDERITLTEVDSRKEYPGPLRRTAVYDKEENRTIVLLSNNFSWTAETIAELYKQRWQIEIFFKELKQHLKIKSFIGTNENAMWIQIWTALITMLLLRYLKEKAKYGWNLSNLITFLRINLFVKLDLQEWLDAPFVPPKDKPIPPFQFKFGF
jgi:IS4 transposase